MKQMKVLVTGSNGFVGKELVKELKRQEHNVEGFDRSDGKDILDLRQVKQAVKGKNAVYHLAAVLDETKPKQMLKVNVEGTENVVETAAKANVGQLIYLSSVGVHGNAGGKIDETAEIKPGTMYETSKARAEKIVWESQEMLPITIIRSALVLGPNQYWKNIVKLVGRGFPIIGGGKNHFQTIYINDLVSALVFVLGKRECFGERFIVAGEETPTLMQLYKMIQKELGVSEEPKTIPVWLGKVVAYASLVKARIGREKTVLLPQHVQRLVRERYYNTGKIRAAGWTPKYGTEMAIKETVREM